MQTAARRILAIVLAAVMLVVARDAYAYCRATTCDPDKGDECETNEEGCIRSGAGLRWRSLPIQYRFSALGTEKLDEEAARDAVRRAFERWENAICPNGGRTSLRFREVNDSRGVDEPWTVYFRDEDWTHDTEGEEALALTNHRYGKHTGFIEFANIELNTATTPFAVSDGEAGLDLESVVTHEVGHYIGLAHSNVPGSVMRPRYCQDEESCGSAELSDDDIAGVCLVYPPADTRDSLPPAPPVAQGCAASPASTGAPSAGLLALGALVIATKLRHTRRHEDRRRRSWRDRLLGRG